MRAHFNGLKPGEAERLACLVEEACEVGQEVAKALRHGLTSHHPADPEMRTNRERASREVGDFLAIVDLMIQRDDLDEGYIELSRSSKPARMAPYMHHQSE